MGNARENVCPEHLQDGTGALICPICHAEQFALWLERIRLRKESNADPLSEQNGKR